MREPIDLRSEYMNGSPFHTMAMALYMLGKTTEPDPQMVFGRLRGKPELGTRVSDGQLLMLELGLTLHIIDPFDHNRFLAEGEAYREQFYGTGWTPNSDLAEAQASTRQMKTDFDRFLGSKLHHEIDWPTLGHLQNALAQGDKVIDLSMKDDDGDPSVAALVCGMHAGELVVYSTMLGKPSLTLQTPQSFSQRWSPMHGITIMSA